MSNSASTPYCRKLRRQGGRAVLSASISLALVASLLGSAPAEAATVNALQGQVLVNSGQGYRLVDGSAVVGAGGTVVANPGAIAQVVYSSTCRVTVQPGTVYLISATSPCNDNVNINNNDGSNDSDSGSGGNGTAWAIGAAAVAAGGAAAFLLIKPGSSSP